MSKIVRSGVVFPSLSKESRSQAPDSVATRGQTQSALAPGRRQRRISQLNRTRVSQTSLGRRRRESRSVMNSVPAVMTSARGETVGPVKEFSVSAEQGGFFDKDISKIELFRRASKIVQLLTSLCLYGHQSEKSKKELTKHTVFTEYLKEEEQEEENLKSELYFDASYFKANRMMYVSAETKHVLSLPPNSRTEQQIAKVKYWLSNIRAFAEYPRRMQQKLVQVGWYEGHPPKRVLIRQGHRPQAFYFVLSGSAVVTVMDKKSHKSRTVHFLKRGDSFGELAILHGTVRQSTIILREFSEFLVIAKEDFIDIFMASGGVKTITDPDHVEFIRSINFLKDWPIDLLAVNPKRCLFHFFRRGAVLVKDSNRSDWIYIIKSGSCRILKKLKQVQSRLTEHQDRVVGFERVSSRIAKSTEQLNKLRVTISALSAFKPRHHSPEIHTDTISDNLACDGQFKSDAKLDDSDAIDKVAEAQIPCDMKASGRRPAEEKNQNRRGSDLDRRASMKCVDLPPVSGYGTLQGERKDRLNNSKAIVGSSWCKVRSVLGKQTRNANQIKRRASKDSKTLGKIKEHDDLPSNALSFLDEEDSKNAESFPQTDYNPIFVEVANLTKGDTFGVNFMVFEKQPSLSLVSNGAECIVISKKFFLSYCTEAMKRRLLLEEQPFPDDETLQKNLQDKINWESFKTKTLHDTINGFQPSPRRPSPPILTSQEHTDLRSLPIDGNVVA